MRKTPGLALSGLLITAVTISSLGSASAASLSATRTVTKADTPLVEVGRRWYRGYADDFYYPPEYYLPPPPVRVYRYVPPPPVVVYEPPVYGWVAIPPPPSSCGKYRYWTGDRCADARYDPPYIGPRW